MKKIFLRLLPTVFALAVSSGIYLFSVFGLHKLFSVWNLSPETLARAPGWAAWIYLNADGILNLSFLLPACILLFLPCSARKKLKLRHLWFALSGAVCAGFLIGILLLSGSIRYPVVRMYYAPAAAFGLALTVFLESCLSARLTRGIFADCPLLSVRFGASVCSPPTPTSSNGF